MFISWVFAVVVDTQKKNCHDFVELKKNMPQTAIISISIVLISILFLVFVVLYRGGGEPQETGMSVTPEPIEPNNNSNSNKTANSNKNSNSTTNSAPNSNTDETSNNTRNANSDSTSNRKPDVTPNSNSQKRVLGHVPVGYTFLGNKRARLQNSETSYAVSATQGQGIHITKYNSPLKRLGTTANRGKICWVIEQYAVAEQMGVYYRFVTHDLTEVICYGSEGITLKPNQTSTDFDSQLWQGVELPHAKDVLAFRLKGKNLFLTQSGTSLTAEPKLYQNQKWVIREGFC